MPFFWGENPRILASGFSCFGRVPGYLSNTRVVPVPPGIRPVYLGDARRDKEYSYYMGFLDIVYEMLPRVCDKG